jgi:hypothetical protein
MTKSSAAAAVRCGRDLAQPLMAARPGHAPHRDSVASMATTKSTVTIAQSHGRSSTTANAVCPWCESRAAGPAIQVAYGMHNGKGQTTYSAKCVNPGCGCGMLLLYEGQMQANTPMEMTVIPPARSTYAPPGVPTAMAKDFREATDSRAAGFLFGASLVGRRVLQAAVRSVVGEKVNLRAEIDAVPADILHKTLKEAAHQVRFTGNDAAHVDDVTPDEVDDLLTFVEEVLHGIFVAPARVTARAAARAQKP